jgi:hypothetical protein
MSASMQHQDGFDRLLGQFGAAIGIPDLGFDNDGLCHIRIDEDLPITFRRDDEQHRLSTIGLLAEALPQFDHVLMQDILSLNIGPLRGIAPAIGVEPASGTVVLYQNVPLNQLDAQRFQDMLGDFIEIQKAWMGRLGELAKPAADEKFLAGVR